MLVVVQYFPLIGMDQLLSALQKVLVGFGRVDMLGMDQRQPSVMAEVSSQRQMVALVRLVTQNTGTASGGTVSFNTGVVTLLSNIARTGGSATVGAGQACAGAGVSFFGDNGGNVTGVNNAGSDGGSPYGQTPSTADTRLIMNLNRTFGFIGGAGATNSQPWRCDCW